MLLRSLTLLLFASLFAYTSSFANDIDGDGLTDLILAEKSGKNLSWSYYGSSSSFATRTALISGTLGKSNSAIAPGTWITAGTVAAAAFEVTKRNVILRGEDTSASLSNTVGKVGESFATGADTNADGLSELIVFSKRGVASVLTSPLAVATSAFSVNFSARDVKRGAIGFLDAGSGDVPVVVSGSGKKTKRNLELVVGSSAGSTSELSLGGTVRGDFRMALPISNGTSDQLLLVTTRGVYVYSLDYAAGTGALDFGETLSKRSQVLVGNFLADTGEEIAVFSRGTLTVINPQSLSRSTFSGFAAKAKAAGLASVYKAQRAGSSTGSGALSRVCPKGIRPVFSGFLWKNSADEKLGPPRANKPVILFQSSKPGISVVNIYAKNGEKVCSAALKPSSERGINCSSDHYYVGWPGGCSASGSAIAASAQAAARSTQVYVQGPGGTCIGPINPNGRNGGIGC